MRSDTYCSCCGSRMDEHDLISNYTIHKRVGYGSIHDGEEINLRLCCSCFDTIVDACAVSPVVGKWIAC